MFSRSSTSGSAKLDPMTSRASRWPASCDSSNCSQCQLNQEIIGIEHYPGSRRTAFNSRPQSTGPSTQPSTALLQSRKRTADAALLSSHDIAASPARHSRTDASFITSLQAPRRRRVDMSGTTSEGQGTSLPSSFSSTQLSHLDTDSAADGTGSPSRIDASPPWVQNCAATASRSPPALITQRPAKDPVPLALPACQLRKPEGGSAQSSATCVQDVANPGSEPEALQPLGARYRLHRRFYQIQQRGSTAVAEPSLQQVAAFQHPSTDSSLRLARPVRPHANIVCDVKFSSDGEYIATAGVDKQIRVYSLGETLRGDMRPSAPVALHRMSAKLSSLAWSPSSHGVITVGDYDGSVQQVHMETGHFIADADEHSGRRVWSVAHSALSPNLTASAGDDGVVRLWHTRNLSGGSSAMVPTPGVAACGVEFSPHDANLLAIASADCSAYVYDLRNRSEPLYRLRGHERAVSFVRFSSALQLVTASVDGTIKCWDLGCPPAGPGPVLNAARTLRGHRNSKNFVGLSVRDAPAGSWSQASSVLIACGSESGATHIYGADRSSSVAQWQLPCRQPQESVRTLPQEEYISSVCWQPEGSMSGICSPLLAVAASDGDLRLLALQNK